MVRFELKIAWRHLVTGGTQTWLTIGAVALGAFLIVFLSSIIWTSAADNLQRDRFNSKHYNHCSDYEPEPAWGDRNPG